jgi:hypothetical protein
MPSPASPKTPKIAPSPKTPKIAPSPKTPKTLKTPNLPSRCVGIGAGITAGLELWSAPDGTYILLDHSTDNRFINDETLWQSSCSSLKPTVLRKVKDAAAKQNATS